MSVELLCGHLISEAHIDRHKESCEWWRGYEYGLWEALKNVDKSEAKLCP